MKAAFLKICFLLIGLAFAAGASAQGTTRTKIKLIPVDPAKTILKEVGTLPKTLKEASGLEYSSNLFWTHNDDGIPALYCLNDSAKVIRTIQVNASNRGWEDLTIDDSGNFYVGGFGNNKNDRQQLRIYKIANPDTVTARFTIPDEIIYTYADQKAFPPDATNRNFDVDAFFALGNSLYLFTKNRSTPESGYSKVYKLNSDSVGRQVAQVVDSIHVGDGPMINNWITSADLSPDKKTVALLLHDRILFIRNFVEGKFSKGNIYQLNLNHYSHKAGLCFKDDRTIFIVDELEMGLIGGKLYSIDLTPFLKNFKP